MGLLFESHYFKLWQQHAELKARTKLGYTCALKKFDNFLEISGMVAPLDFDRFYYDDIADEYQPMDREFMDEFVDYLMEQGASDHTLYHAIESIRSFMRFLSDYKLIKQNPIRYYENPHYKRHFRDRALSKEESKRMLAAAVVTDPFFRQNFLLILLLLTCGLRKEEVLQLRVSQVNFEDDTIKINRGQKTNADTVDMTASLKIELQRYLNHPMWLSWSKGKDREVFFCPEKQRPLRYEDLRVKINVIAERARINRQVKPHDFRHTMAHLMHEAGINPVLIQRQLRHAKLSTTMIYLQSGNELQNIIRAHSKVTFEQPTE